MSIAQKKMWLMTDALGLPENLEAFSLFALGYPDEEREQLDRYDESRIHWVE